MLLLIRGKPHTGKTTMGKKIGELYNWYHLEPSMAFATSNGDYVVDQKMLEGAKQWCFNKSCKLLLDGYHVVVSDNADILPYQAFCKDNDINMEMVRLW